MARQGWRTRRRLSRYAGRRGAHTVSAEWVARAGNLVSDGRSGQAMFSFLTEIVGLSAEQASELAAPGRP